MIDRFGSRPSLVYLLYVAGIIALQALALFIEGHPAICTCGYVKLWDGAVNTAPAIHSI